LVANSCFQQHGLDLVNRDGHAIPNFIWQCEATAGISCRLPNVEGSKFGFEHCGHVRGSRPNMNISAHRITLSGLVWASFGAKAPETNYETVLRVLSAREE